MKKRRDDYVRSLAHAIGDEPALSHLDNGALPTFGSVYRERRAATTPRQARTALLVAALVSGPFAVIGALMGPGGALSVIVMVALIGPLVEEMLKVAGALYLTEVKPWLVPSGGSLVAVALISGLVFAAIENAFYLWVIIEEPSTTIIRWRWTFGPLIHGTGSLLAGIGVARMWTVLDRTGQPPRWPVLVPWLAAAVVVHGSYNFIVTVYELAGGSF